MRVITGTARGRRLKELEGKETRPTTDRVKEGLFNIIQFDIEGRQVLDLFAGTGQLGIEALSRGAESAVFVDCRKEAARLVEDNLRLTGLRDKARVVCAGRNLSRLGKTAFECPSRSKAPEGYWFMHFAINPTAAPTRNEDGGSTAPNWESSSTMYRRRIRKPATTFLYTENKASFKDTTSANPFVGGWHNIVSGAAVGMIHLNRANWGMIDGHAETMNLTEAQMRLARLSTNSQQMWE